MYLKLFTLSNKQYKAQCDLVNKATFGPWKSVKSDGLALVRKNAVGLFIEMQGFTLMGVINILVLGARILFL